MNNNILKRYTDISALLYLLKRRVITLLDPMIWDDKNDSIGLLNYKKEHDIKTLLALCFTEASETYHHWYVFARGLSGVCITFKKNELLDVISVVPGITHSKVKYIKLNKYRNMQPIVDELQFIKRHGFQDEIEYRIIYKDNDVEIDSKDVEIPLTCVDRITLSPWIPDSLSDTLKEIIKEIDGCSHLHIIKSRLISSREWINLTDKYIS